MSLTWEEVAPGCKAPAWLDQVELLTKEEARAMAKLGVRFSDAE